MKKIILFLIFFFCSILVFSQTDTVRFILKTYNNSPVGYGGHNADKCEDSIRSFLGQNKQFSGVIQKNTYTIYEYNYQKKNKFESKLTDQINILYKLGEAITYTHSSSNYDVYNRKDSILPLSSFTTYKTNLKDSSIQNRIYKDDDVTLYITLGNLDYNLNGTILQLSYDNDYIEKDYYYLYGELAYQTVNTVTMKDSLMYLGEMYDRISRFEDTRFLEFMKGLEPFKVVLTYYQTDHSSQLVDVESENALYFGLEGEIIDEKSFFNLAGSNPNFRIYNDAQYFRSYYEDYYIKEASWFTFSILDGTTYRPEGSVMSSKIEQKWVFETYTAIQKMLLKLKQEKY